MARVSYLLIQTYKEKQNEQEKLRGTFQILDGNILMLVHPSSRVRDVNHIILIDSFGNAPKKRIGRTILLRRKDEM
jgi:hypothetical protein